MTSAPPFPLFLQKGVTFQKGVARKARDNIIMCLNENEHQKPVMKPASGVIRL